MNKFKQVHRILFLLIFILSSFLLGACANNQHPERKNSKNDKNQKPAASVAVEWKLPLTIPEDRGDFYKVIGWFTNQQIFYVTNLNQTSNLFLYNLITGKSKLIYTTENPIVNVQISPSKKYLMIHTSSSANEGMVTIIDTKGTEHLIKTFPSYDLVIEWNPYNESKLLVTKFEEDWSFQISLLDTENGNTTVLSLPQPFVQWNKEQEIAYIDWDQNSSSLTAPLIFSHLEKGTNRTAFSRVIQFAAYPNLLMTVTESDGDSDRVDYSFFDKKETKLFSFSTPQLKQFSDWLVPFYDFNGSKQQFITFQPLSSGDVDTYTEGFQLIRYDLKKGTSQLILENLDNLPISISPSGEAALLGNSYEKIIDLNEKKIYDLIKG
ncbi:hypothetical protein [Bacillus sp. USDA818B3_A]|uniref:YqgU-like beta propeller domain-containing protein n=1 Tax=Bacillus sp. USDA818B3_A TaxID=2698834 RepID=UPI00136FBAFE|nr:hypothetical protein [Bacillus sp. USDA818B3_A]